MAEALEDGGHAVQALAAGVHPREHGVEFVGDAFLFGQGGKGNLAIEHISFWNTLLAHSAAHHLFTVAEELRRLEVCKEVLGYKGIWLWPTYKVLGTPSAHAVWQASNDPGFPILKARGNSGEQNITVGEMRIAFLDHTPRTHFKRVDRSIVDTQALQGNKTYVHVVGGFNWSSQHLLTGGVEWDDHGIG